ncbi:MAG: hypothetical protein PHY47_12830 [Lachnospiraceae bacterium]|nr:hypothetical protein [Lachnospiraceae bacterium]
MSLKIGDYVQIREDLKCISYNDLMFTKEMLQYRGKIFKIQDIWKHSAGKRYDIYILENIVSFIFNDSMLLQKEIYENDTPLKIIIQEKGHL